MDDAGGFDEADWSPEVTFVVYILCLVVMIISVVYVGALYWRLMTDPPSTGGECVDAAPMSDQILPPIYYMDMIADPLSQDDLRETLKSLPELGL